jgi:rubrerythrin
MTQSTATAKPEKMTTLTCKKCRMALYMSERELQMPTWQCPSCGAVTKTAVARS